MSTHPRNLARTAVLMVGALGLTRCTFDLPDVVPAESIDGAVTDASVVPDASSFETGAKNDGAQLETGQDGSCPNAYKSCSGSCVRVDNPDFGCTDDQCTPCAPASAHATYACTSGACMRVGCLDGYSDCDHEESNGCEADLTSNAANCGSCGKACSTNHTVGAKCENSKCVFSGCDGHYVNCNGTMDDGCETDTTTPSNCGSCGNACPSRPNASPYCGGSTCHYQCAGSGGVDRYENCDGDWSNGCEIYMTGNPDNCGKCGNVCPPAKLPNTKRACDPVIPNCTEICLSGHYNCDSDWSNGCESTSSCN